MTPSADIAVIGGSGFYSFLEDAEERHVPTPYGDPSGPGRARHRRRSPGGVPAAARRRPRASRRTGSTTAPTLWALRSLGVRQVLAPCAVGVADPRRRARRRRGARPARRPHPRPGADLRRDRRLPPAVRRPLLRARRRRRAPRSPPDVTPRRHDGRRRGAALLDPRRVAALRRAGLAPDQHDRPPRGGARPRDAAVLRRDRAGDRHGRRRRAGGGVSARRRSSRCSPPTSSGSAALLADTIADAARPRRLPCATWADGVELTYEVP